MHRLWQHDIASSALHWDVYENNLTAIRRKKQILLNKSGVTTVALQPNPSHSDFWLCKFFLCEASIKPESTKRYTFVYSL